MVTKKSKAALGNPYLEAAEADDQTSPDRIAYEIVAERRDVLPSVQRIMDAGLEEPVTFAALSLFRSALGDPLDPNRDPRAALAAATAAAPGS